MTRAIIIRFLRYYFVAAYVSYRSITIPYPCMGYYDEQWAIRKQEGAGSSLIDSKTVTPTTSDDGTHM
jgi:hypothetical protein